MIAIKVRDFQALDFLLDSEGYWWVNIYPMLECMVLYTGIFVI